MNSAGPLSVAPTPRGTRVTTAAALIVLAIAASVAPAVARAQRPPGADTLSARAVAESLAVLQDLDAMIKTDPRNAALWFRRGMIAWALYDRDRAQTGVDNVDWTRIGRMADTSLRIAKELDPDNPRYVLGAGQYFLGTGLLTMRAQSYAMFGNALEMARVLDNRLVHAEAALEVGRVYWRRYDAVANGGVASSDAAEVRMLAQALSRDSARTARGVDPERTSISRPYTRRTTAIARRTLDRGAPTAQRGFLGEADYLQADLYVREAYETMPTFTRAYRQLAILLAERARWAELEALAEQRVALAPADAWTWMTLGLATYRLGDTKAARTAFERGLREFSPSERERLDRIERVMRPADTTDADLWIGEPRARRAREFWMTADPLWSIDEVDARAEFLARVAFAELRWTVEELAKRGADSDRGNVYIRYGPADRIASANAETEWTYDFHRLRFRFKGAPSFGTSYFADFGRAHRVIDSIPALWDNTHLLQIDSIAAQAVRFRASRDSVDVYFAVREPVERIRRATDLAGPARSHFWLLDSARAVRTRDSVNASTDGVRAFTRRLAAAGAEYGYRFEATGVASLVAGRASGTVVTRADSAADAFALSGFGVSDVLLATTADDAAAHARWTDAVVTPLLGPIASNGALTLVWENYELASADGNVKYRIAVAIERQRSRVGRIGAQIVGALARAAQRSASLDRVEFAIDRAAPAAPVVVDQLGISLGGTPAGEYLVTLSVTDLTAGQTVRRTARIVVGDPRAN